VTDCSSAFPDLTYREKQKGIDLENRFIAFRVTVPLIHESNTSFFVALQVDSDSFDVMAPLAGVVTLMAFTESTGIKSVL